MELLIPGLILVALMVYASTRIKKTAALAFEAETIETDEFIIQKPDGFLTVLNGDPQYAFESYSKEYGTTGAENFRKGIANLRIYDGSSFNEAAANIVGPDDEIIGEGSEVIGEHRYRVFEIKRIVGGVEFRCLSKLAERSARVYEFQITAITETTEEFMRSIEAMLNSFEIK
ncbi:MAG: hypothetical protein ABIO36_00790 [Pyrinomonadaceae bacterium]